MSRVIAIIYTALAFGAGCWAWVVDMTMLHSGREHLLPAMLLSVIAFPLSMLFVPLYALVPSFLDMPFVQLTFLSVAAALQATLLWWISARLNRPTSGHA
jgi:hypothetical protein